MMPKRVALLIETSTSWGAAVIDGIGDYIRRHDRWVLYLDHRGVHERLHVPYLWEGDGIIARVTSAELMQEIAGTALPAVNVSWVQTSNLNLPTVTSDESAVGQLAARHLLDRGLTHFGYYGPPYREHYEDRIEPAFAAVLADAGRSYQTLKPDRALRTDVAAHDTLGALTTWLTHLPKPVGVLAQNAIGARQIAEACAYAGLRVPDEVAVLAADHDELMASVTAPPLSCIDPSPRQVGYRAAELLDAMMAGQPAPGEPVLIEPRGVINQRSTDTLAVEDETVATALRFIHDNAHRPIKIVDVLEVVTVSRRSLEKRFEKVVGRPPATEIRLARLQRARRLLAETNLPIAEIAERCGFSHPEVMQRLFRRETDLTPSQFRRRHRQAGAGDRSGELEIQTHPMLSGGKILDDSRDARSG